MAARPSATAIASADGELSYAELNARANQLAHFLRALGVGPEVLVGLALERSVEMVVAVLAVLKAGGGYVPVDPDYPPERAAFVIEDSGVRLVVAREHMLDRLPNVDAQVVCLDRDAAEIEAASSANPHRLAGPLNVAYVIYTSGSSGRPKGVVVPHRGVCNLAHFARGFYGIGPADRLLQYAALGFDVSVWEIVMALLNGALLYVPTEVRRRWRLAGVLREGAITVLALPPSALAALRPAEVPAGLRVVAGGEACPPDFARTWSNGRVLFNAYGPTETTICVSIHKVGRVAEDAVRVPIGAPIANTRFHVLDADLQPMPTGTPGVLYIGGVNVTRGYLGRPGLTAERFVPDLFAAEPGSRMYCSGDLVCARKDGEFEFLGRIDDQLKVRGLRIEPGEIETALRSHAGLHDAAVVAQETDSGDKRLVAFIVTERDPPPADAEVRDHLAARLPEYMIPNAIVTVDRLPLSPNGKVDRRALSNDSRAPSSREPAPAPRENDSGYRVVANSEEQYSILPQQHVLPDGWRAVGTTGTKRDCLAEIERRWIDIRPTSLRT